MSKKTDKVFRVSQRLALPLTFVTGTQALLGKKGGGKTYKAKVECEELLEHGHQCIVMDPTGAWWGLRSSADGKSVGYPITIFGGDHADVPLESTAGGVLAEAIVSDGFSAIIDLSAFTKGEEQRFCAAFLERLYQLNKDAVHLFLDEADVFAPQRPFGEEMRTLGACQSIVRRGRIKGIGCTLITQRPQVLNKDVLSQVDMLTVLRMNHPKDIGAIDEWVRVNGDHDAANEMKKSLPALPQGDAWVWSPADDIFERITFRDARTFDSGRTPRAGEKLAKPRVLAAVDLERLGESIRSTVERAKANDPKQLRAINQAQEARIADLERTLQDCKATNDGLGRHAMQQESRAREAQEKLAKQSRAAFDAMSSAIGKLVGAFSNISQRLDDLEPQVTDLKALEQSVRALIEFPTIKIDAKSAERIAERISPSQIATLKSFNARQAPRIVIDADPPARTLPPGEDKTLRALIQYPRGLTVDQLSTLVGYRKSARNSYISRLIGKGLAERAGERILATAKGRAEIPDAQPLPTGAALRNEVLNERKLPPGERAVLEVLIKSYPSAVPPSTILPDKYQKSARNSYISRLVSRELVERVGREVKAADALFGIDD